MIFFAAIAIHLLDAYHTRTLPAALSVQVRCHLLTFQ